jgi:type I restriction-modification system DNA methylase subunit
MPEPNNAEIGFEKEIWKAADLLRGNLDASEYKSVVLGLIFLKYISDTFEEKYNTLVAEGEKLGLTKKLTDILRKNKTIDWQKKETARIVKRLLKSHRYPPEKMEYAIEMVIGQCEMMMDEG